MCHKKRLTLSLALINYTLCCQGREKDATIGQQRLGHVLTQSLRKLIDPYFLRRTKEDVGMVDSGQSSNDTSDGAKYVIV